MASSIDYFAGRELLNTHLIKLEGLSIDKDSINFPEAIQESLKILFKSKTQSYREIALGCAVVRFFDQAIDLSLPYINLGEHSYNGRTLDEKVINPFLHSNEIPASKGPYLATFRRSVKIDKSIRNSQKDKDAFDSLLVLLNYLNSLIDPKEIGFLIDALLVNFIMLRDQSKIELAKIRRLHLEQHKAVLEKLLNTPSGGLLPVLIAVALLSTINKCYSLEWKIEWQGINESDSASGAGGDVTITKNGENLCVLEITERSIDSSRVTSTFNSKIVKKGISNYLFVYTNNKPSYETKNTAGRYFAQGHEINFIQILEWTWNNLATLRSACRDSFLEELINLIAKNDISSSLKVKWNEIIRGLAI